MDQIKYTYLLKGQNTFMKIALNAIDSELHPILTATDWEESSEDLKSSKALNINMHPTMAAGSISILGIGLVLFVGNWGGNKLLDEIYESTLKEPVTNLLNKIFSESKIPKNKLIEYQQLVTFEDLDLTILIRLPVKRKEEISQSLGKLINIHKLAAEWINTNGRGAAIHCYLVENGTCNIEPVFYDSLEQIEQEGKTQVIRKIMKGKKPNKAN